MSTSCPGFLDRYGIWNNGFDCSSSRICCGTETDRYCCIPSLSLSSSSSSSSSPSPYQSFNELDSNAIRTTNNFFSEKWFFLQMCTIGIFLAIILLIFATIYLCVSSIRHITRKKKMSIGQQQSTSALLIQPERFTSNRISTISSASSDVKSQCTDTSIVLNTPLNRYPTKMSRNSTVSSYYIYPNEFEYLCT